MRNTYLCLSLCMSILAGSTFAQEAYVTGNTKIKIEPNTLVYFGDNLNLNAAVNVDKVIENDGNVKIDGNFINNDIATDGKNFVSTWTSEYEYGQVIINEAKTADALSMQKGAIDPNSWSWGQFAIPFNFASTNAAMQSLFGGAYQNGSNRYTASMMKWDNVNKPEFDHLNNASTLSPTEYVILNLYYASAGIKNLMNSAPGGKMLYKGLPSNGLHAGISLGNNDYYGADNWNTWKEKKNSHNERYKTYIEDYLRDQFSEDATYGKYGYQYGNPYTSNIDLSNIGTNTGYDDGVYIQDLKGVYKFNDITWNPTVGTGGSSSSAVGAFKATFNGTTWAGDADALIIKPFEPFVLTLNSNTPQTFSFSDKLKTFTNLPRVIPTPFAKNQSNSQVGEYESEGITGDFYQLGLRLYNEDGSQTGNRVYVVVASGVENGVNHNFEAEYADFNNRTGFYLAQENVEGLPVKTSARKMDINAVNPDFVNKPIPMFLNRTAGDTKGYYVKADLFHHSIFNKLDTENQNFEDGNSFFFFDDKEDVMIPITTDFSYYIAPEDIYGQKLRYEVYWNADPLSRDHLGVNDEFAGSTIIYKNQNIHQVKFNENWTNAEVKVYDMTGRNIQTFENVNAKSDFAIKLPSKGVYVVRIKSNTGEVYTQKIIK